MNPNDVPSADVVSALARYAELLAQYGPDSPEAEGFFDENKHLQHFEQNANDLYRLEKEDYDERSASHLRSTKH